VSEDVPCGTKGFEVFQVEVSPDSSRGCRC
jgi:hypothetical protein